jgi:hypothetical protein
VQAQGYIVTIQQGKRLVGDATLFKKELHVGDTIFI